MLIIHPFYLLGLILCDLVVCQTFLSLDLVFRENIRRCKDRSFWYRMSRTPRIVLFANRYPGLFGLLWSGRVVRLCWSGHGSGCRCCRKVWRFLVLGAECWALSADSADRVWRVGMRKEKRRGQGRRLYMSFVQFTANREVVQNKGWQNSQSRHSLTPFLPYRMGPVKTLLEKFVYCFGRFIAGH